uniref:Uncharacterized protein n=1 Tax=Solanum lycopersicum TaxID=4081 RepID=K4CTA4_SOLLC
MGIDLTTAGKNPSLSISMFAKLASFLAFMKLTLTDISSIFVDGRILVFSVGGSLPLPSKQVGLRLKRITLGLMSSWNHGKNLRKRAREWISLNQKQDMCCLLLKYLPGGTKLVHRIIPHEWSPICINWMK